MKLFNKVFEAYPNAPIIAEDLGVFGDDVVKLLEDTGFPGMKVVNSDLTLIPTPPIFRTIQFKTA